ncbi:Crp/Fnr family transcriptional regulator [Paracoccus rhizosphaerae]|uniref:Crp/Fnr family transcriptional regulator n=1 Tax=Paracoccus rhizosphaerae TaxID=1133347 RepID=A0ABV6CI79_9RHOB|nr:Crp/Fnr family transcriptional regulator [Paracoccus rhizosphaerae]
MPEQAETRRNRRDDAARPTSGNDWLSALRRMRPPLLRGASDQALAALLDEAKIVHLRRAREVLRQGEAADCMYLILKGRIEVTFIDVNGNRVMAHLAVPGEVMGEAEQFSGKTCAATCTALPDTTLMAFDASLLVRHLSAELLLRNLASIFHERLTRDNRQHSVAMFYTAEDRVRIHLLSMSTSEVPDVRISQTELAGFAGCSRQTVNKVLSQLRAEGIVDIGRGAIRILDRAGLEQASITGERIVLDDIPETCAAHGKPDETVTAAQRLRG